MLTFVTLILTILRQILAVPLSHRATTAPAEFINPTLPFSFSNLNGRFKMGANFKCSPDILNVLNDGLRLSKIYAKDGVKALASPNFATSSKASVAFLGIASNPVLHHVSDEYFSPAAQDFEIVQKSVDPFPEVPSPNTVIVWCIPASDSQCSTHVDAPLELYPSGLGHSILTVCPSITTRASTSRTTTKSIYTGAFNSLWSSSHDDFRLTQDVSLDILSKLFQLSPIVETPVDTGDPEIGTMFEAAVIAQNTNTAASNAVNLAFLAYTVSWIPESANPGGMVNALPKASPLRGPTTNTIGEKPDSRPGVKDPVPPPPKTIGAKPKSRPNVPDPKA